jgi:carboxypeptidase Q
MIEPLAMLGVTQVKKIDEAGADLIPIQNGAGPFVASLAQDMTQYFDWHHTESDTLDKVDPASLSQCIAAFVTVTYALAESATRLPPSPPIH